MLEHVLGTVGVGVDTISPEALTAEVVATVEEARPACICVAAVPPGGLAHTRYLLKRLRARFPDICVVVGRWSLTPEPGEDPAPLVAAGATRVGFTLSATRDHVLEVLPLASQPATELARSA
jgi:hypothetical protein